MNDAYSLKILEALQEDSRMTVQQISERVGLSTTPCWKRIKEMEALQFLKMMFQYGLYLCMERLIFRFKSNKVIKMLP